MDKKELYAGAGKAVVKIPGEFFRASGAFSGIRDDLHVRAVLLDNGEQVCLVSLELNALTGGIRALQALAAGETGIPADHIWIMATHTASAPDLSPEDETGLWAAVETALRAAVRQAVDTKRRGYLSFGRGESRTNLSADGKAPSDHTVTVFQIEDEGQRPITTLYHFGVQSCVLRGSGSGLVSADLTGAASAQVEAQRGGVAMLLLGACGDQVPRETAAGSSADASDLLEQLGSELGGDILRIAGSGCKAVENPGIAMYHRTVELPAPAAAVPLSVLRIGRTGLVGLGPELNAAAAMQLHEDAMFLGALTVQQVNGSPGPLTGGEACERLTGEAVRLLRAVQDGLHRMDPAIAAKYPHRLMDVPYADEDPSQKLDIWYPNDRGSEPLPVVLMLHGGAFQHGDKFEDTTEPMLRGLDRGYAVVSGNYRLAPQAIYPASILDGKKAIHYLRANARQLGIDPDRIAVWGYSSGGWLVSMLAVTAGNPAFSVGSEYSERVQAVVDWCGPCGNFVEMDPAILATGIGRADHNDARSPESVFMGAQITKIPEKCAEACPIIYVGPDTPPVLIVHGDADPVVPLDQSQRFYRALRTAGCDAEIHIEPGKGHHGDYWYHETWLSDLCYDFLDRHLK